MPNQEPPFWDKMIHDISPDGMYRTVTRLEMEAIVAKATELGIEKGKREAMNATRALVVELTPKSPEGLSEKSNKEEYWDNGYVAGARLTCLFIAAKLSSLS